MGSEGAHVRAAQRGSASDLEALFRLHWPRAFRTAFLVVHDAAAAEDIAQEAFLAAVRNLDRFDRRRPFGPWLHRIVVNRAIDWTRARQLRGEAELLDAEAPEQPAPLDASLLDALAALPRDRRPQGERVKKRLEQLEIPYEHEARERSWAVVRAAFAEREPMPRR